MLSCPQSNGDNPHSTVSVSGLSAFTQTSDPMTPYLFRIGDINFSKTVFSKPISHLMSDRLSLGIANKQALLIHFSDANFDAM